MRQFLADKVMGNLAGLWLLVPELLRLGAWDLVCGWTTKRRNASNRVWLCNWSTRRHFASRACVSAVA